MTQREELDNIHKKALDKENELKKELQDNENKLQEETRNAENQVYLKYGKRSLERLDEIGKRLGLKTSIIDMNDAQFYDFMDEYLTNYPDKK